MPIFRIDGGLYYFAHVPKCAGTAIEIYLTERFGQIGLRDSNFLGKPPNHRWSQSSPQHIDTATLSRLIPYSFFDGMFTVVRHPVDRLVSVFRFQRDLEDSLPGEIEFGEWLDGLDWYRRNAPFYLDNHPRPMTDLVPGAADVFRMENGLDPVIEWLDARAGNTEGPRAFRKINDYQSRLDARRLPKRAGPDVTPEIRRKIATLYAGDFERFGYDPMTGGQLAA